MTNFQLPASLALTTLSFALTGSTAMAQVTYVDADTGNQAGTANTTYASGGAFMPSTDGLGAPTDNTWHERTGFAEGGDVLASNMASDSPRLRTTISGLAAGAVYQTYAYYWVAIDNGTPIGTNAWDFSTGLTQATMVDYAWDDGVQVTDPAHFTTPVLTAEGNRALFEVDLGPVVASAAGTIDVFVDDVPGNTFRTWYDGVGIDAPGGIGSNYCTAAANSTGLPGTMSAAGSTIAANNNLTVSANDLPNNQFGIFVTSMVQGFVPGGGGTSNGNICLGGSIGRYRGPGQILSTGMSGSFSLSLDLTTVPQGNGSVAVMAGETWNFQAWHRDGVGLGSNFTDGLEILFN